MTRDHLRVRRLVMSLVLALAVTGACGDSKTPTGGTEAATTTGESSPTTVGAGGGGERHVALPTDKKIKGLTMCGAFPATPREPRDAGMVLYGDASAADPYDGSMVGLLWNTDSGGDHSGDGDAKPVTVRGQPGVAAPITVFQQTILPNLGTVIAWKEGGRAFGLYGRRYSMQQTDELVAVANAMERSEKGFRIPTGALPHGFTQVFAGDPTVTSIYLPVAAEYAVHYRVSDGSGILLLTGQHLTESEFEAFRFFTVDIHRANVAGHRAFVGNAWTEKGPVVVTWREQDGLVVRLAGLGVSLDTVREAARDARELSDSEWATIAGTHDACPPARPVESPS